jgi:hypothetical protein
MRFCSFPLRRFGPSDGDIVRRLYRKERDRVGDTDLGAGRPARGVDGLGRRPRRDDDRHLGGELAHLQVLEDEIESHQLGERGRMPVLEWLVGVQNRARLRLKQNRRPGTGRQRAVAE